MGKTQCTRLCSADGGLGVDAIFFFFSVSELLGPDV